jgi:hypothetical protein
MVDRKNELKRRIATERDQLSSSLEELETKARSLVDWRAQFDSHPLPMLAAAFGGGLLLSGLLSDSGRGTNGLSDDDDEDDLDDDDLDDDESEYDDSYMPSAPRRHARRVHRGNKVWDEMKGALLGVAATRAVQFLDGMIPGVKEEFKDRRDRR